jgi:hypothetical protein
VDIRGAFDNVWWPGLFDALRTKQFPHEILAIIKNYLTDRAVSFTQGNVTVTKNVTKGSPQGSVLGPTLWNLLLDPFLDSACPEGTKVVAYDLRLLLYDAPIKQVKSDHYLGIIIDLKFNFETNVAHTTQRARNITLGLRRRAARHWGQSAPATLRAIYRGAILPILTYASPVWISSIRRSKVN